MPTARSLFVPPHCPNTACRYHTYSPEWRWKRFGYYERRCTPQRIPRLRCLHCKVTFSSQTFHCTYYLKAPKHLVTIAHRIVGCSCYRQIARELDCSPNTVKLMSDRIGRHALLYLMKRLPTGPIDEPLVVDGLESFAHSQFQPLYLNNVVGSHTHYTYAFTISHMRRKGSMTAEQRAKRARFEARYGRPQPDAIERGTAAAVRIAAPFPQALTIHSDEHKAYPRAFRTLAHLRIAHERTPSTKARTPANPLHPVNLLDHVVRHSNANHKRETIAFSKRHQGVVWRHAWTVCWRNFCKHYSEKQRRGSPAMFRGLTTRKLNVKELFVRRLFYTLVAMPEEWKQYYRGRVYTSGVTNPRSHALRRAF